MENDYTQKYDITEKTYSQEGEESHTHITESELTSLARSVSDIDMANVDTPITSKMHSIKVYI